jgi:hypothetical protein
MESKDVYFREPQTGNELIFRIEKQAEHELYNAYLIIKCVQMFQILSFPAGIGAEMVAKIIFYLEKLTVSGTLREAFNLIWIYGDTRRDFIPIKEYIKNEKPF